MTNFEAAKEIALERNEKYNKCQEYTDAWYFYFDDGIEREGGGDAGVIIEKKTGKLLLDYEYFMDAKRKFAEVGKPRDIKEQ